jgi:twitching motility protein PilT
MAKIDELLKIMVTRKASDLHLTTGFKPFLRVDGGITPAEDTTVLSADDLLILLREIMPPKSRAEFEQDWDTDFAYQVGILGRFRVNAFMDNRGPGAVMRAIPARVPTLEELGLPAVLRDFCHLAKGLVVVTGPTGSGKSTTLAAMIDYINKTRTDHIITIEDPIEFVYKSDRCLINQREVHSHTRSFANALRAALREDPDIVLVGEMRDLETMEIAIETAETGHLVFGTLHTNTAPSTVNRIIDQFPADRQNQVRTMLADSLKGVVAQNLCKKTGGGRVAAMEILAVNYAIASNIREGKTHQIPSLMQVGKSSGMQLFNDSLLKLVAENTISNREAYLRAVDKDGLLKGLVAIGKPLESRELEQLEAGPGALAEDAQSPAAADQTLKELRAVLAKTPDSIDTLNNLAWILATTPHAALRNPAEAVKLAERADRLTHGTNGAILDTLSVVYAHAGRFDKATDTGRRALKLAEQAGDGKAVEALRRRIAEFQAGRAPGG